MKQELPKPKIAIYQSLGAEQKIHVRIEDENAVIRSFRITASDGKNSISDFDREVKKLLKNK